MAITVKSTANRNTAEWPAQPVEVEGAAQSTEATQATPQDQDTEQSVPSEPTEQDRALQAFQDAQKAQQEAERDLHALLNEAQDIPHQVADITAGPTFDRSAQDEVAALQVREAILPAIIRAARIRLLRCQVSALEAKRLVVAEATKRGEAKVAAIADERQRLIEQLQETAQRYNEAWWGIPTESVLEINARISAIRQQIEELAKGDSAPTTANRD